MMLKPGTYLQERYEILDRIGSGGMSEVYRARCHKLNRLVAIKLLKEEFSQDSNFVSKFKMEAQSAAGLSHPNIVSVYDVVDEDVLHYIVMEVIEGITLKSYITKKGRLGVSESIGIAIQVAQGIAAAHDQHIIHRDIKPQNMIISKDGKVKVADFGIARAVSSQTVGATAVGSVHYISPEQARGGYSDARSDIYSLGITMYEMVTGQVPFDGENTVTIALAHLEEPIEPPSDYNPAVTPSLERIILKCTQKNADRRYYDAYELIADLRRALVDPEDDFLKQKPNAGVSSPTVIISGNDLSTIQDGSKRAASRESEEGKLTDYEYEAKKMSGNFKHGKKEKKKDSLYDVNPQIEKILTTVGIGAAIIIIIVLIAIFTRVGGGIFNSGSGKENPGTSSQETGITLGSTESRVPLLTGMSKEDAKKALQALSLVAVYEYRPSEDDRKGLVIGQDIAAETMVPNKSSITLVIGDGSGKIDLTTLELDKLTGADAQKRLEEQMLTVVVMPENSPLVPKDYVVRFEPTLAAQGESVTLYVSAGPVVPPVTVPNIANMTPEQAKAVLEALQLTLGVGKEEKSTAVPKGLIIEQTAAAGTDALPGTAVDYTISIGKGTKFVAVVDDDYPLKDNFGPGSGASQIQVEILMRQMVHGEMVETVILQPRLMGASITIPVRYSIEGADGVLTGELIIYNLTDDKVLKTYPLEFLEVDG